MKGHEKRLARLLIDALEKASESTVETAAKEFVRFLALRGELRQVRRVIEAIEDVWQEKYTAATIKIETAYELSSTLRKKLEAMAPGAELIEDVHPEIIGGIKLQVDYTILDGSIKGHLSQLHQALRNV